MINDPIADMLTRVRNAYMAGHSEVVVPASKIKMSILSVLKKNEYVGNFTESKDERGFGQITISLIENPDHKFRFNRVSKLGQRIYKSSSELFKVRQGFGISVVSTSQGVMTGEEARAKNIGGEVLLEVY